MFTCEFLADETEKGVVFLGGRDGNGVVQSDATTFVSEGTGRQFCPGKPIPDLPANTILAQVNLISCSVFNRKA